jgi:hypothetical protein
MLLPAQNRRACRDLRQSPRQYGGNKIAAPFVQAQYMLLAAAGVELRSQYTRANERLANKGQSMAFTLLEKRAIHRVPLQDRDCLLQAQHSYNFILVD